MDVVKEKRKPRKLIKIYEDSHVSPEYNSRISRISIGYQPDIKAFCAPVIMSCHPLDSAIHWKVIIVAHRSIKKIS